MRLQPEGLERERPRASAAWALPEVGRSRPWLVPTEKRASSLPGPLRASSDPDPAWFGGGGGGGDGVELPQLPHVALSLSAED